MFTFVQTKKMKLERLIKLFTNHKEESLFHRYITNNNIEPLLRRLSQKADISLLGSSVRGNSIYAIKIGSGAKRILMWSQMHGNESTTTKAAVDLINTLTQSDAEDVREILKICTICIVPILNPDGALAYTRVNANGIDLNRDAQNLSQPESKILRALFEDFKPNFCYNLHGQRTIFSAGNTNKSAILSFLAPAQDEICTITPNRTIAMEIIAHMNEALQTLIPGHIGVYDDAFNLNCVGDTFQSLNIPTVLFEAGHHPNDYPREETRRYIYISLLGSLHYIASNEITGSEYKSYLNIPENEKLFFDIIIRNANLSSNNDIMDVAIQYQETLVNDKIEFIPRVERIEDLTDFYGHKEFDARNNRIRAIDNLPLAVGYENDFVIINNEKISLLVKENP